MIHDNILTKLITNNKLLDIIGCGFPIEAIVIGGSRVMGLNNSNSDYDLSIIVSEEAFKTISNIIKGLEVPRAYFKYKEKKIHWYYSSPTKLKTDSPYYIYYHDFWLIQASAFLENPKNQLLVNNKNSLNTFIQTVKNKSIDAIKRCKSKYYDTICQILKLNDQIFNETITKDIYSLCTISCILTNTPLDNEKLLKIKEYASLNLNLFLGIKIYYEQEITNYCRDCLQKLLIYFEEL